MNGIVELNSYRSSTVLEKVCGVYKITNPEGQVYVGQSKNIHLRWYSHKKNKNISILTESFTKFGYNNHLFEIVELCNEEDLIQRERHWQEIYKVVGDSGLNSCLVSTKDYKADMRDTTKDKIKQPRPCCQGSKNHFFGKSPSKETKALQSIKQKENFKNNPEYAKKISEAMSGEKHRQWGLPITDYQKSKISERLSKLVLDSTTGIFFNSALEASESYNIRYSTMRSRLNGNVISKIGNLIYC